MLCSSVNNYEWLLAEARKQIFPQRATRGNIAQLATSDSVVSQQEVCVNLTE